MSGATEKEVAYHGTVGGYTNHRCRCQACTRAHTAYKADYFRRNQYQRALKNERDRAYSREGRYRKTSDATAKGAAPSQVKT